MARRRQGQGRQRRPPRELLTPLWGSARTLRTLAPIKVLSHLVTQEAHIMDATSKTALVVAFVIAAFLLLFFGGGMTTGTIMSGGMMGSGSMGGISGMWLPTLLVVALGIVLFSSLFGEK